jgi:hypothetical protein
MISNLESVAGTQPEISLERPIGEEFQIGDFLIRRFRDDKFLVWNREGEMLQTDSPKLESALREFFDAEF